MPVFEFFLRELASHVLKSRFIIDFPAVPKGVMILQRDVQYLPECVYIGSWKDVSDAIFNGRAPKHSTFFVAGGSCSSDKNICQCPYNIVFTDLSIPLLNNILNSALVKLRSLEDADTRLNFNNFLYEILLNSKLGSEEIQEMVDSLDFNLKKYLNIIVINFSNSKTLSIESPKIFSELEPLFAQCNMSVFAKKITILYTSDEKQVSMPKELAQRFNAFLEKYDAFASFGMPFRKCSVIRTKYYIVANILRIAMRLEDRNNTRIFNEEDYGTYVIIDLCARQYEALLGNNDIIYLGHPGLIELTRYDIKHKSDLRDVLYCYLCNDRNLSKTAKEMFMHRNTVLNKINKINKILDDDLDSYTVRFRLSFSFMIIKYYEQYKNLRLQL